MRKAKTPGGKTWYWKKTKTGMVREPRKPHQYHYYRGQSRCTKNFKKSKRRRFMLKVISRLGQTRRFNELVAQYKKQSVPESAAFVKAMSEIGQMLRWMPEEIDIPDVKDWLPEPIE